MRRLTENVEVGLAHGVGSWDDWDFFIESRPREGDWVSIRMSRSEALRARRRLDILLKATAPPRKKAR